MVREGVRTHTFKNIRANAPRRGWSPIRGAQGIKGEGRVTLPLSLKAAEGSERNAFDLDPEVDFAKHNHPPYPATKKQKRDCIPKMQPLSIYQLKKVYPLIKSTPFLMFP